LSVQELKGALLQYERASKIAEIYKRQVDTLNSLYEKQDMMLGKLLFVTLKNIHNFSEHFRPRLRKWKGEQIGSRARRRTWMAATVSFLNEMYYLIQI
jgi:hypothetical protein